MEECEEALLELRAERTEGRSRNESTWLFAILYSGRCRHRGTYTVQFVLDGVRVCEKFFTVALGFSYPNRRIQKYVRMIKVSIALNANDRNPNNPNPLTHFLADQEQRMRGIKCNYSIVLRTIDLNFPAKLVLLDVVHNLCL